MKISYSVLKSHFADAMEAIMPSVRFYYFQVIQSPQKEYDNTKNIFLYLQNMLIYNKYMEIKSKPDDLLVMEFSIFHKLECIEPMEKYKTTIFQSHVLITVRSIIDRLKEN